LSNIDEIWEQVAEDFAPFNVDVTTEEPAFDDLWCSSYSDSVYGTRVDPAGCGTERHGGFVGFGEQQAGATSLDDAPSTMWPTPRQ
jgi:hypothetical protein